MKNSLKLDSQELDYLFSPQAIRKAAEKIFERTQKNETHFHYHPEKLKDTVDLVLKTIQKKYPSLQIPFHSRWGHFKAGNINRLPLLEGKIANFDRLEQARIKLDLVITSVLLDAGAGSNWKYVETSSGQIFSRSEGLGLASLYMFLSHVMSSDRESMRADSQGLKTVSLSDLKKFFQVSSDNPLEGIEGRLSLLNNLSLALENKKIAGAGLDVFEIEPLPQDSPLRHMSNVLLTPHNAYNTVEAENYVHDNTIKNLVEGLGKLAEKTL